MAKDPEAPFGRTPTGRPRYRCYDGSGKGRLTVRQGILKALADEPGLMAREIADRMGKAYGSTQLELRRMKTDGEIEYRSVSAPGGAAHRWFLAGAKEANAPEAWTPESKPCPGCGREVVKPKWDGSLETYWLWLKNGLWCGACPTPFVGGLAEIDHG